MPGKGDGIGYFCVSVGRFGFPFILPEKGGGLSHRTSRPVVSAEVAWHGFPCWYKCKRREMASTSGLLPWDAARSIAILAA